MLTDRETELKRVETKSKRHPELLKRDPSLTGGERGETPTEKTARRRTRRKPKRAPVIQRLP